VYRVLDTAPELQLLQWRKPFAEVAMVRLAAAVQLESLDDSHAVLFHGLTGARIQLARRVRDLLVKLRGPVAVEDLLALSPSLASLLKALYEKAFLVDAEDPEPFQPRRLLAPSAHTAFHCPPMAAFDSAKASSDVVFLGVPFDLGSTVISGQRRGPSELRIASNEFVYETAFDNGRPLGWYDIGLDTRILEGVRLLDAGDFCFEYGESVDTVYERLGAVWQALRSEGTLAVALGGDHSITYSFVERLQREQEIALIWFDAHSDESFYRRDQSHHYGNVLTRIRELSRVRHILRVGTRGAVSTRRAADPEHCRTISARDLRRFGSSILDAAIPAGMPCYLSIDLDVLDPSVAPAVGTPVPGGLMLHELEDAIAAIAQSTRIEALDLVELNPDRAPGNVTACTASRLLLIALHHSMQSRRGEVGTNRRMAQEEKNACSV
jgi:agmatinase